jgi:hypothetical protein
MSADSDDSQQPQSEPETRAPSTNNSPWKGRGRRDHSPLKLLGALRGEGVLLWLKRQVPVAYEIDVYQRGAGRTASGNLEGDLSALVSSDKEGGGKVAGVRLRLADGREIGLEILELNRSAAGFDAHGPAVDAGLLP